MDVPRRRSIVRRIVRCVLYLIVVLVAPISLGAIIFNYQCSSSQPTFKSINAPVLQKYLEDEKAIPHYTRTEGTTYLTFPEWYLVFNPQEYGQYIQFNKPSHFPYFHSIGQFWEGYCQVYGITKQQYPFSIGDHLTEAVIGISFTAEYSVKGIYENTIGRLSEWTTGGAHTSEDLYAAKIAQAYGAFIPTDPWYAFPFGKAFVGLWKDNSLFGPHFIRKWERKLFLSFEYGVKAGYASLIKAGTHSIYGVADTEIYALVTNAPITIFDDTRIREVSDLGDMTYIITLPHYQGFTDTAPLLAKEHVQFLDIAGNDEVLVTARAPLSWKNDVSESTLLFTMKVLTNPEQQRVALQVPVTSLSALLFTFQQEHITLEHIYDY